MHKRRTHIRNNKIIFIKIAAISVLSGIAAVFALSLVFSTVMMLVDVSDGICRIVSCVLLSAGALVSGMLGAFLRRRKGALTGAVCGLAVCLIMFIISTAVSGELIFKGMPPRLVLTLTAGAGGGVYGVNRHISRYPFAGIKE